MQLDEAHEIWRYDVHRQRWRIFAIQKFKIRSIGLSSANSLVAGSVDDGRIAGFDLSSGKQIFASTIPAGESVSIQPVSHGQSIFVGALASRHSLFRINARTGVLESGNFNRFSGPAKILAISPDGGEMVLQGVGLPQGQSAKASRGGSGLTLERWDANRLLPIGEGVRTGDYDDKIVAFSPTSDQVAFMLPNNPRIATMPLSLDAWMAAACQKAGRSLTAAKIGRFLVRDTKACAAR